jgi:hypothetical protein
MPIADRLFATARDILSRCLFHLRLRSRFPKLVPEHMVQNEGYARSGIEQQNGIATQVVDASLPLG